MQAPHDQELARIWASAQPFRLALGHMVHVTENDGGACLVWGYAQIKIKWVFFIYSWIFN
jgi:hypothetical protein